MEADLHGEKPIRIKVWGLDVHRERQMTDRWWAMQTHSLSKWMWSAANPTVLYYRVLNFGVLAVQLKLLQLPSTNPLHCITIYLDFFFCLFVVTCICLCLFKILRSENYREGSVVSISCQNTTWYQNLDTKCWFLCWQMTIFQTTADSC